jgi:hypothetical protein
MHFNVIAVVRGRKIRANQQEDYICCFEMFTNFTVYLLPRDDTAIVPTARSHLGVSVQQDEPQARYEGPHLDVSMKRTMTAYRTPLLFGAGYPLRIS